MFQLDNTLVSEDLFDYDFVCNLSACKGACCIDGDAGAPLEESETELLVELYRDIKPYLTPEGIAAIEEQGAFVKGFDGEWETPLIDGGRCAYVVTAKDGITYCGIEAAQRAGKISWKKPISCHLYPVRLKEYESFTAVNYHQWGICSDACSLGEELKVPVYKFLKEALIRKFGQKWYDELELIATEYKKQNNSTPL